MAESMRVIRLKGAKVCLMPTYGMWHDENEDWMKTRGYENQMFLCFAHPRQPDHRADGKSRSQTAIRRTRRVGVRIDLDEARDDNHLQDRRPDLYEIVADVTHDSAQPPYNAPEVSKVEKV